MSILFTDYAYRASDIPAMCPGPNPCERTTPNRLADIKDVRDFGAKGDGVTDDWAAIMAAFNWTVSTNRGTIFFPPGTYLVSAPIDFSVVNVVVAFCGVLGASTVVGSFADYVFKKGDVASGNPSFVENLTVVNNDPNGGGIRLGACVGGAVRNCTVTANRGINTADVDTGGQGGGSLEYSIENCLVSPGANTAGSIGIMSTADGPILNCRITGYEIGMILWGQEGARYIAGCYFEGNGIAFKPGFDATGGTPVDSGNNTLTGCLFKNNGTALYLPAFGGFARIMGVRIEADEGVTVYGSIPQYGIRLLSADVCFGGVVVTGQYGQYAVSLETVAVGGGQPHAQFFGVNAFNTSTHGGLPWLMPTTAQTADFLACNCPAPVYTMANLPAFPIAINTASWSAGTTTLNMFFNMSTFAGRTITVVVSGVTPSGYNGTFTGVTVTGVNTIAYSQSNPGSPTGSGGTIVINANSAAQEGDCYNVSDSDVSTWASNPVGGGSTHAKVRWGDGGTNWTVVGK